MSTRRASSCVKSSEPLARFETPLYETASPFSTVQISLEYLSTPLPPIPARILSTNGKTSDYHHLPFRCLLLCLFHCWLFTLCLCWRRYQNPLAELWI